jgi:tRNA (pseudouridine54-N1)-methyltransferase
LNNLRRFVIVGARATTSPDFLLVDIPGTSGRLDVLLRCLRAALLVSHGLRRDTCVYLVLLGSADQPRTIRVDGSAAKYLRPDERSLATLVQKVLRVLCEGDEWVEARPGVLIARGGIEKALTHAGGQPVLLDEHGDDIRTATLGDDVTFVVGGHQGLDAASVAYLEHVGARRVSIGPVSVHADDAVTIVSNELDRQTHL